MSMQRFFWLSTLLNKDQIEFQQQIEENMKLSEYFSTEPLGARGEMAEYLGISLTWLSLLIHERRTASAALAVKIEKATQGLVTRKDLRPDLFFV
jgi:DNA-binding transcriptional regulator YdaS (Cro superfamily)